MTDSKPSLLETTMFKHASKLPYWQREQSQAYRRFALSRRFRLFIILGCLVVLWCHFSRPGSSDANREYIIDSKIAHSYPPEREKLVPPAPIEPIREPEIDIPPAPVADTKERADEIEQVQAAPHIAHDLNPEFPTEDFPRKQVDRNGRPDEVKGLQVDSNSGDDLSPKFPGEDVPRKQAHKMGRPDEIEYLQTDPNLGDDASPEFPGEDVPRKQAVLDTRRKFDSEHLELVDFDPPALVKQASEKLIEQHLSPAAKYDRAREEKLFSANRPSAENYGPKRFPPYAEYAALDEKAEALPDIIHIPFEESTSDVELQGWEDLWYSDAELNPSKWGNISETKIDFVYTWVNGSEDAFRQTIYPYEVNSTLNDPDGAWLESHRVNRYRDWDELRYSIRSIEKYAGTFRNKIQLLVNAVADPKDAANATVEDPASILGKQRPLWLKKDAHTRDIVQVLSQEDFFDETQQGCLPTFNSLTIENQIFNTKSDTDRLFALSDDMLLGKSHAASDIYSPLFGPTMGFKSNSYNTVNPPTDLDARRFGEKPFLIYSSWLLNRRFGERKRKGQIHFGHSISRSVTREAIKSFPRPALQSACQRFRGETGFQLYSWYVTFHYTIERQREALLWSYLMIRSDLDRNGNLGWEERQTIMEDLEEGMTREGETGFRKRMFYHMNEALEEVGLEAPKVNVDVQWTSLDGPVAINNIECFEFNVNECLAPGFSTPASDETYTNHVFSTASIFDRVTRQHPKCGDCLIKLLLNRVKKGFSPLLPHAETSPKERETVIKALWKYQYTIVDPDAFFVMVTDAEQVENVLFKRLLKKQGKVGQLCLNDDVSTEEEGAVAEVRDVMIRLLGSMVPEPSAFENN